MRRFLDGEDREWEIVVGRESWGAFFAIFIPREEGAVRQTLLPGSAYDEATRELDELDDSGLADLFRRSEPKTIG